MIYLALNSLYTLMQSETGVMAAASLINPEAMEGKFNAMIEDALIDYKSFIQKAYDDDMFKITTMINFKELFEFCFDIRKKEKIEAETTAAATGEQNSEDIVVAVDGVRGEQSNGDVVVLPLEKGEKPPKQSRKKY